MHKDTVIKMARDKIKKEFGSTVKAAEFFGVDKATLYTYLNNHVRVAHLELPDYLLEYLGLGKHRVTTYHKL